MARRPMVAGNWKMHCTAAQAARLAGEVVAETAGDATAVEVVLAPPYTALPAVAAAARGSWVRIAAQDMHWRSEGAFTGAIGPTMVAEFAPYVIVGHSERRTYFGETDESVNRKLQAAFEHGLTPIACLGETEAQRDEGRTDEVIERQLGLGLAGLDGPSVARLVIAYEPVWAIGTGRACDPEEAARVVGRIRAWVALEKGAGAAAETRLLYGGSVKADNAAAFFGMDGIDGALVGGASLEAAGFAAIVRAARQS